MNKKIILSAFIFGTFACSAFAAVDVAVKERKPYGKSIRTRMPPQIVIETLQQQFKRIGPEIKTEWNNFVVEDEAIGDEFLIIARTRERKWAFAMLLENCPKPQDYEILNAQVSQGGTPVRLDVLIGVKRKRSWFRYVVNFYEPMFQYWTNPCYVWNLPPGSAADPFYGKNYRADIYSKNLIRQVYDHMQDYLSNWKPPKKTKRIAQMKGPGQELVGEAAESLTEEERALPIDQQEKILNARRKVKETQQEESVKEQKRSEKELKKERKRLEKEEKKIKKQQEKESE